MLINKFTIIIIIPHKTSCGVSRHVYSLTQSELNSRLIWTDLYNTHPHISTQYLRITLRNKCWAAVR